MNPADPTQPNTSQTASSQVSPFSSSVGIDIPPAPSDGVHAAPPVPAPQPATTPAVPQPFAAPAVPPVGPTTPPPPPPQNGPLNSSQSSIVTHNSGPKVPKKLLLLILSVIFLVLGVFVVVKVLLPKLTGQTQKTTITWWGLWEESQTVQPLIDEYQSQHPDVVVQYERAAKEQYRERLSNALAQGTGPDIMTIHNSWVPMFKNVLSPMPSTVFSPQEYQQTFYPVMVSDLTLGSDIVGIPTGYDGLALYVNDEIFNTYGKTPPKTWNELRDLALELTVRDEKGVIRQSGIAMGSTSNVDDWQEILGLLMLQNGADLKKPTGEFAEQAITYFTILSTKDGNWNDTLPNSTALFANGKLAMMVGPSWRAHEILQQKPELKFHVVPVPQLPKNDPNEPDMTYATYWASAVSSKSAVQTAAWDFLKFMSTKESYEKLYTNASRVRAFGQPYPRIDMRDLIASDPKVGAFISLAGTAKSWYLADRTWDGDTGINSRMAKYFEDAVNSVTKQNNLATEALGIAAAGVNQVLVDYGLVAPPAPVKK